MPDTASTVPHSQPLIRLRGICKAFPGVVANDRIDLDIYPAEIHALLGENGAGKSTLVKILYGFYGADSGRIELDGRPLSVGSPHDARAAHIGLVFQDLALIPAFSVAENVALFLPDLDPVIDMQQVCSRLNALSGQYGLQVDPLQAVASLSIGEMQKVEILKLLMSNARVLILDEPTRVLAPHEVDSLLEVLRNLRSAGYAIVLITHKLNEVLACADRITVLRRGRLSGTLPGKEATEAGLIDLMFEKGLAPLEFDRVSGSVGQSPILELRGASTRTQGTETPLADLELAIHPGEIVGVAGVSGNGQKELADLLLGIKRCASGRKLLHGEDVSHKSVRTLRSRGVSFIPENPLAMATIPFMSVLENFALTDSRRYARWGGMRLDWPAAERDLVASAEKLQFSMPISAPARSLSGGNLQRMVIVRELARSPRLIIASYLTRGLDVQSAQAARKALIQARAEGCAILLISEDLEELFSLSDRLLVLYEGRVVGSFRPAETSMHEVGYLMTGSAVSNDPQA
jgi:simple sugar transport system ATP-binding protein